MADLLSGKVGASLVAAGVWSRASGVSEGVYEAAKARKDTDAMQRAASYMGKSAEEAGTHAEKALKALGEAKRKAAAEEKKAREDAAKDAAKDATKDGTKAEPEGVGDKAATQGADTVDLSAAGSTAGAGDVARADTGDPTKSSVQDASAETAFQGDLFFLGKNVDVKV